MPHLAVSEEQPAPTLAEKEANLADQFSRLELLAGRLAELSKSTQPRRAELLRQLVAKSREREMPEQFQSIVNSLEQGRLNEATEVQKTLHSELQAMLELLLQEDRDRQIESETKRINKYLAELNKLIRQQRGIKARTAGGDAKDELIDDQNRTADSAGKLGDKIAETEGSSKKTPSGAEAENSPDSSSSPKGKPEESSEPSAGEPSSSESAPSESSPSESSPSESAPSQSPPSAGEPSEGKPSKSSGQPSQSQGGSSSDSPQESSEQQQSPADSAEEKLKQAQQRMQQAEERLKESQRDNAVEEQEKALRELEQAKAELEKILRQLREEELERMLVMLEARLRKMLEGQNNIYEQTIKLEESIGRTAEHELEIASATLGRKEDQIVGEVDRALILLKEDGSSVAFPEALQQVREDMQTVANRLRSVKTDRITQGVEQDIIETLEEMLAALQQALKDLREKRSSQQQSGSGEPGEQPLVDQLAELRMIRALQNRVNRRTEFYDTILEGEQAKDTELLEALDKLAERQQHIFEATRDLHQGANR